MEQEKVVAIGTSDMMQVQSAFNHRKTHVKNKKQLFRLQIVAIEPMRKRKFCY